MKRRTGCVSFGREQASLLPPPRDNGRGRTMNRTALSRRVWLAIFLGLFVGALVGVSTELYGQGVRISPLIIEVSLNPGEIWTETITIENSTDEDLLVELVKADFDMLESGAMQFLEAGSSASSLTDWLSLPKGELVVKAGETKGVSLSISRPEDDSAACPRWGAIIIQVPGLARTIKPEQGPSIAVNIRYAVPILQWEPMLAEKSGRLVNMDTQFVESQEGKLQAVVVSATFVNSCENILKVDVRFEVRNETGDTVATDEIKDRVVLPGHRRIFTTRFSVDDWPPGRYLALAILDYGGETLTGGQWPFGIPGE